MSPKDFCMISQYIYDCVIYLLLYRCSPLFSICAEGWTDDDGSTTSQILCFLFVNYLPIPCLLLWILSTVSFMFPGYHFLPLFHSYRLRSPHLLAASYIICVDTSSMWHVLNYEVNEQKRWLFAIIVGVINMETYSVLNYVLFVRSFLILMLLHMKQG